MNEIPELPSPPPEIPKGRLWASLAAPPVVTLVFTMAIGSSYNRSGYGEEFLFVLPMALLTICCCLITFISAWRVRYRGRSLVLTSIGYFLGQIILCLGLWFGGCFLILA